MQLANWGNSSAGNGNAMQRLLGVLRVCLDDLFLGMIHRVDGVEFDTVRLV